MIPKTRLRMDCTLSSLGTQHCLSADLHRGGEEEWLSDKYVRQALFAAWSPHGDKNPDPHSRETVIPQSCIRQRRGIRRPLPDSVAARYRLIHWRIHQTCRRFALVTRGRKMESSNIISSRGQIQKYRVEKEYGSL